MSSFLLLPPQPVELFISIQIWSSVSQSEISLVALDHFRWQNAMFMFLIQISLGFYMKSNKYVTNKRKFELKLNVQYLKRKADLG